MDTAQDILQIALDSMGQDVEMVIIDGIDVRTRYGTLRAIANARKAPGDHRVTAFLELSDYRLRADAEGGIITARTLVDIDELASIRTIN